MKRGKRRIEQSQPSHEGRKEGELDEMRMGGKMSGNDHLLR